MKQQNRKHRLDREKNFLILKRVQKWTKPSAVIRVPNWTKNEFQTEVQTTFQIGIQIGVPNDVEKGSKNGQNRVRKRSKTSFFRLLERRSVKRGSKRSQKVVFLTAFSKRDSITFGVAFVAISISSESRFNKKSRTHPPA